MTKTKPGSDKQHYVLGLDLGAASLGWAVLNLDPDGGDPTSIQDAGVRIFEAGVEGDIESGRDASRAKARRDQRLMRRQHWRRTRRLGKLFRLLQGYKLLPPGEAKSPQQRHDLLLSLDAQLRTAHLEPGTLHHTCIVSVQTKRGEVWEDRPVDRMEVHRRLTANPPEPVVQATCRIGERLVMWLCKGDCIEMDNQAGRRSVFVVRGISQNDITVRLQNDARIDDQIEKAGERSQFRIRSADVLRKRHACPVTTDPLGRIQRTNHRP